MLGAGGAQLSGSAPNLNQLCFLSFPNRPVLLRKFPQTLGGAGGLLQNAPDISVTLANRDEGGSRHCSDSGAMLVCVSCGVCVRGVCVSVIKEVSTTGVEHLFKRRRAVSALV